MRSGIRLSGKRLGRPSKDPKKNAEHKQQLLADQRKRNEVEGRFGTSKRKNSLNLIMAKLKAGAEGTISLSFLVMCVEKILRLLRLFFVLIFVWLWSLLKPHETARRASVASGIRWTDLHAVI
jgi:IS5 family transposase